MAKEPIITGREGGPIKLDEAASWTKNYRDKHPGETISQFFGREILERILAQEDCLGIRFYYAYDKPKGGKKHLIMTGVIHDGTDQIHEVAHESANAIGAKPSPQLYTIGEQSSPCPGSPGCPSNVLSGKKG